MEQGDRIRNLNSNIPANRVKQTEPSEYLKKVITLLNNQITRNDIERQNGMLKEFMEMSRNGFWVKDIFNVMYLIELLLERINEVSDYVSLLEGVLEIYSIPPVLTMSSDVLTYDRDLQEYFSMLGYLLVCLKIESLRTLVAFALINLLTRDFPNQRWYLPLRFRKKYAENSRLPEILGQMLEIGDEYVYPKVLDIVILLTNDSDKTCKELLHQDALNSLFTRLEPTWKERYPDRKPPSRSIDNILYYEEVSTMIWILLKYLNKNRDYLVNVKNITLFSVWNIQYVYRLFAENKNKYLDRNNVLSIIIKLIEFFPNIAFVKSGLAEDLILLTRSPLYTKTSISTNLQNSLTHDDYTFMQLLLTCIPHYRNFIGGITALENHRTMYWLLKFSRNKQVVDWPVAQECTTSFMALDVLEKIIPYMEDEFIENGGPNSLLYFLAKYNTNEYNQEILKKCLITLNTVIRKSSSDIILNSILFNNGLNIVIDNANKNNTYTNELDRYNTRTLNQNSVALTESALTKKRDLCNSLLSSRDSMGQSCLGFAFCFLKTLYKQSAGKSKLVIDMTINYMKQILHPESQEPVHDQRTIICLIDFMWEHIVMSERSSIEFIKRDGAFLMLDIIHKFPFPVQLVTLGALVDLCEYGYCIPYLITWRGRGKTILPLLMNLFKEENKRLNVKSGPRGQISDVKYPIMGKQQWIQTFCRCIDVNGNPVLADLFVSCRPKIYALLQMLNERFKEEVQLADEHYKSYSGDLKAEDQVTMVLAENFLALKLGEAWVELKTELDRIPLNLIPADEKMISYLIERAVKWSSYLQIFQNGILQNANEKDLIEEQKLYNILEESRLSDALQALNELIYLARCSERMFRLSQKFLQNIQIDVSLTSHSGDECPHRTYFSRIQVTPVFNQIVDVESKVNKSTEEIIIVPISPTGSIEACEMHLAEDLLESSSELNCE